MNLMDKINETAQFLKDKGMTAPEFGLILGSGLGELAGEIENAVSIDYAGIPNWGRSTVVGHAGKLVYGDLAGRKVLALQGRFHFYEGNPMEVVTFPVRVMRALGCEGVIVTNAAGGVEYGPGTLMAISDHINLTGQNPLIGANLDEFGPRFPDMSDAYTKAYREKAHSVAEKLGIVYYDNEIIDLAAKEMGFDVDVIRKVAEQKASGFMYSLSSGTLNLPLNDQVYTMQSKIIRHLANYDTCIIVSGCADYILEDYDNVLKVFIHAPLESRIKRVKNEYQEIHDDYKKYVVKKDKSRSNYYNYYTTNKWGQLKNFDLTLNSDLGLDEVANIIVNVYLKGNF